MDLTTIRASSVTSLAQSVMVMGDTHTCSRCGDDRPLHEVIVHGPREDPDEVVCPDCAEPEDRIVTDGGRAGDGARPKADRGPHP